MLSEFVQHQAEQPRSQSGPHFLKVQYAHWDSELDCRWKDGEASVGREKSLKLQININKTFVELSINFFVSIFVHQQTLL